jgi:hypothetical protein
VKHKTLRIMLLLIVTCPASISQAGPRITASLDCGDMKPDQTESRKTAPMDFQSDAVRLYGSVQLDRAKGEAGRHGCSAVYKLFLSSNGKPFVKIKEFSDQEDDGVGVDIIGASNGGNKIAADFW